MALPHDDSPPVSPTPTPPPLPVTPPPAGGANLDPLTHEPGAHPVGVGVGAAGIGAVGALIGAVAGPVGLLVGTVVGALTGAVVGKETAETVNPTEPAALAARDEAERTAEPPELGAPAGAPATKAEADETYFDGGSGGVAAVTPIAPPPLSEPAVAEPAPPPAVPAAAGGGPRLHKFVLPTRATFDEGSPPLPPPLEITAHLAYPEDLIRDMAYFRYLERQRTGQPGGELDDWTEAERKVLRG